MICETTSKITLNTVGTVHMGKEMLYCTVCESKAVNVRTHAINTSTVTKRTHMLKNCIHSYRHGVFKRLISHHRPDLLFLFILRRQKSFLKSAAPMTGLVYLFTTTYLSILHKHIINKYIYMSSFCLCPNLQVNKALHAFRVISLPSILCKSHFASIEAPAPSTLQPSAAPP